MIKYTTLDAVLNYIPRPIIGEYDTLQLKSWMIQFYRTREMRTQEAMTCATIEINQHKAVLPKDLKRIIDVRYQDETPETITIKTKEIDVDKLLIYQQLFFEESYYVNALPLRYIGQNRSPLIDKELWCADCSVGFTVDSMLSCLTITYPEGTALLVYTTDVKDANDNILIPDDSTLHLALSWAVQANYWNEKKFSHEANSANYHQDALTKAQGLYNNFQSKRLRAGINPNRHNEFVFKRNPQPHR